MDLVWFVKNWKQLAVYKDRLSGRVQLRAAWLVNSSFGSQEPSAAGSLGGAEKRGSVMRTGFERILYSFGNGLVFYLELWLVVRFGLVENL